MAHHTTTWGLCRGRSWSWRGFVGAHYRHFCLFTEPLRENIADHHQISNETLAARIRSTCLSRTVPHKICAASRTNVPLFTESKATRNPTTVVSDPSHNLHKQYCQLKMGNVKCRNLYVYIYIYIYIYTYIHSFDTVIYLGHLNEALNTTMNFKLLFNIILIKVYDKFWV